MATQSTEIPNPKNRKVFQDYSEKVEAYKDEVGSKFSAKTTNLGEEDEAKKYTICLMDKADKTSDIYQRLDLLVAISAQKEAETYENCIKENVKFVEEQATHHQEIAKTSKSIKEGANEVKNEACKLMDCLKDEKVCDESLHSMLTSKIQDLNKRITDIMKCAETLLTTASNAFGSSVEVAGIQTFSNVDSLESFGKTLSQNLEKFKKNIDENFKGAIEDSDGAKKELSDIIVKRKGIESEADKLGAEHVGLGKTFDFVCSLLTEDMRDKPDTTIEAICKEVEKTFSEGKETMGTQEEEENWDMDNS